MTPPSPPSEPNDNADPKEEKTIPEPQDGLSSAAADTSIPSPPTAASTATVTTDVAVSTAPPKKQAHGFTGLPMDWTQMGVKADDSSMPPIRFPQDVADWSMDDLDLCIVGTAGQKITQLPKDFYKQCNPQLESLVLRSHIITALKGLDGFQKLDTLEFYDNQIQALDCLEGPGPNLRVLDFSYNSIREMTPLALCPNLQELCKSLCFQTMTWCRFSRQLTNCLID